MMSDEVPTSMLARDKLYEALSSAQAEMGPVPKSGINPAFKSPEHPKGSPFSTLLDVIETIRKPFTSHGLCWKQSVSRANGEVLVTTTIGHKSGQETASTLAMPCGNTAQAVGSAISYGRRYSLLAECGLASDDDDDGNAAVASVQTRRDEPRRDERREPAKPTAAPDVDDKAVDAELMALVQKVLGHLPEQNVASLRAMFGLPKTPAKLTADQKQIFLKSLRAKLRSLEDVSPDDDEIPWSPSEAT